MNLDQYLDNQNIELWTNLNDWRPISVEPHCMDYYECYVGPDRIAIYVNENSPSTAAFTHELLHVFLYKHEMYVGQRLKNSVINSTHVWKVISDHLINHISNCLEHIKMLPLFLERGYQWEEFTGDAATPKLSSDDISLIQQNITVDGRYNGREVDRFIGKFIAVAASPNPDANIKKSDSAKMVEIEPELYGILTDLICEWNRSDIFSNDIFTSYGFVVSDFIERMEAWCAAKEIFNRVR